MRSSWRMMFSMWVTPASPPAASDQAQARPISTPLAPWASAFRTSSPERTPPSISTVS